ncbi:MAG: hypothetical protein H6797_03445 [Candidatus Nomurabacteria bacterium]|nr:MAG: hypothetical protein H6797_03445 [Candidatus Nomurabacteria bacterium]
MDIRKITPCVECPRNCKPARFDESDAAKAASYLLVKAVEKAGGDISNDEKRQADADEIQRSCEARYTAKRALGAIGSCGTKIGESSCESWQLDESQAEIITK